MAEAIYFPPQSTLEHVRKGPKVKKKAISTKFHKEELEMGISDKWVEAIHLWVEVASEKREFNKVAKVRLHQRIHDLAHVWA